MSESRPIALESILTCPHCATQKTESMTPDACQIYYTCTGCHAMLKTNQGDCCVFCSFGSIPCPSIQNAQCRIRE
ncbi:GDCCVxC domain-containing (seleno)protein [Nitrospira sp. M1]